MAAPAPDGPHRACFGSEFCQTLLPSPAALREALARGAPEREGFTLLTPPLDGDGLERVGALLTLLEAHPGAHEVVVNDWGALRLLRGRKPRLLPVLGRLLARMLRDPRIQVEPASGEAQGVPLAMQQAGFDSPGQLGVLRDAGVEWVEVDNLRQGLRVDLEPLGLRPSMHLPFGVVTSGRVCLFAGLHARAEDKFGPQTPCRRECGVYQANLVDPAAKPEEAELLQQGNTIFYRQEPALVERGLAWTEASGGRVVLRRGPFDALGFSTEDVGAARRWLEGAQA